MFTEQNNIESTEILQIEGEGEQESVEVKTPSRLQCVQHCLAFNVCLNSNCSSYVFLCDDKTCQCYKQHKGCIKGSIESINEAIQEKLVSIEPFKKMVDDLIQNAIDELSLYGERIIQNAEKELNFIGLTQNERKFIKAVRTKKVDQLTGKDMNEIFSSIDNVNGFNDKMKILQTQINEIWRTFNSSMKKTFSRVEFFLQTFVGNINYQFFESLIVKTKQQKTNLINFFDNKVQRTELIYRASQNNFDTALFYQHCKNLKNTIVVCETEYGKIIGGFSANTWIQHNYNDYRWDDSTKESFVFSLTNNDKLTLQDKNYAFRYTSGYGPMFGNSNGTDFFICNKANKQRDSGANINNGYYNVNYTRGEKESWKKFSGSEENFRFLIKEWQVWHVKFIDFKCKKFH